ncbi:MAG: hypothetical protein WBR29_13125 [Gammaproteobacteria bacterium]
MEQRSEFVTVVAWLFIIFSAMGILVIIMEGFVFSMLPFDKLAEASGVHGANPAAFAPAFFKAFLGWIIAVALLFQGWVLTSSIGLLLRKNWGRISFIVFLVLSLIWNGLYLIFAILMAVGVHFIPETSGPLDMRPFMQAFMGMLAMIMLVVVVLFGWIVKKLVSEDIRKEFIKPTDASGALTA